MKRDSEQFEERKCKRQKPSKIKLQNAPPVNSLRDLIELGNTVTFYKNLNSVMLWKITPYLEELDNMIGMESLKSTMFYQIIYYLQGMHSRNNDDYLHTIIIGPPGCGKCLGVNTPILMYDGTIKMVQDIKVNDIIMGDDSTPRNVLTTCSGKEQLYEIEQTYGDNYIVNESHILSLKLSRTPKIIQTNNKYLISWYNKYGKQYKSFSYNNLNKEKIDHLVIKFFNSLPQKGSVIDISVKDYLKRKMRWKQVYKGYKTDIEFEKQDIKLDPYVLGKWLGKDDSSEDMFDDSLKQYLSELNLLNNKHIPRQYLINNKENRFKLLKGILKSKIYTECNEAVKIIKDNKKLSDDILFLSRSLGIRTFCQKIKVSDTYYNKLSFLNYENYKSNLMYNIKIKKLKNDVYYGFEIDGNRRFVLGDFTVTHNTTVAKIIGKIYQNLEILSETGEFKIAYRDDFVAEYLGQTAKQTRKLLKSCIGGVLFIDEVYALGPGQKDKDSFSKEAIDTITSFLSEHKNDFCCIAAGYDEDIKKCFFSVNKGLERRFPWVHKIEEYSSDNLTDIFLKMIKEAKWDVSNDKSDIVSLIEENKDMFINAGGDIETFFSKCKMFHSKRVFTLEKDHKFILTKEDMENAIKMIKEFKEEKREEMNVSAKMMYC